MLTVTGMVFIPACLAAMTAGLRGQLIILGMGAVLSSAAVVNLSSFGIQPGYFVGLLLLGAAVAQALMQGTYRLDRAILVRMAPLGLLLLASLNALFWANAVFWDQVWVVSGRQMFDLDSAERYSFRPENVNQFVYLMLNFALVLVLANRLVRLPTEVLLRVSHAAIRAAFALATFFVAWDWLANRFGWYFPDAFLHSNAFYAAAHNQSFGDISRISGPFSEPSGLAYAYGGFLAYASACYLVDRSARSVMIVLVAIIALTVSTSTTAYAVLALWMVSMPVAVWATRQPSSSRATWQGRTGVVGLVVLACAGGAMFVRTHQDDIQVIYERSIAGKTESGSYQNRTGADRMGLESFGVTWGLGLGLGSHRPGNLPVTLLSNVGLPGTVAFVAFVGLCLYRPRYSDPWPGSARALWPLRAFTLGLLFGHLVSSPNINSQLLWLSLTLNLAATVHTKKRLEAMQANISQQAPRSVVTQRPVAY